MGNFNVAESDDGTGVREGSYNVALPDGRIQHVKYTTNDYDGFVAEITYDGQAQSPPAEASCTKACLWSSSSCLCTCCPSLWSTSRQESSCSRCPSTSCCASCLP